MTIAILKCAQELWACIHGYVWKKLQLEAFPSQQEFIAKAFVICIAATIVKYNEIDRNLRQIIQYFLKGISTTALTHPFVELLQSVPTSHAYANVRARFGSKAFHNLLARVAFMSEEDNDISYFWEKQTQLNLAEKYLDELQDLWSSLILSKFPDAFVVPLVDETSYIELSTHWNMENLPAESDHFITTISSSVSGQSHVLQVDITESWSYLLVVFIQIKPILTSDSSDRDDDFAKAINEDMLKRYEVNVSCSLFSSDMAKRPFT